MATFTRVSKTEVSITVGCSTFSFKDGRGVSDARARREVREYEFQASIKSKAMRAANKLKDGYCHYFLWIVYEYKGKHYRTLAGSGRTSEIEKVTDAVEKVKGIVSATYNLD